MDEPLLVPYYVAFKCNVGQMGIIRGGVMFVVATHEYQWTNSHFKIGRLGNESDSLALRRRLPVSTRRRKSVSPRMSENSLGPHRNAPPHSPPAIRTTSPYISPMDQGLQTIRHQRSRRVCPHASEGYGLSHRRGLLSARTIRRLD